MKKTSPRDPRARCPPVSRALLAVVALVFLVAGAGLAGCPDAQGAACGDDGACDEGVCVAGVCTVQPCNGDSDCPGVAVCGNGTCVARADGTDAGGDEDGGALRGDGGANVDGGARIDGGPRIDGGGANDGGGLNDDGGASDDGGADDGGADDGGGTNDDGGVSDDGGARVDGGDPKLDGGADGDGGAGPDGGADGDGGAPRDAGDGGDAGACYGAPPICPAPGQPVVFVTVAQGGSELEAIVDGAADGTLIVVQAGDYTANVQHRDPTTLTMVAAGGEVRISGAAGPTLEVRDGAALLVQGFTLLGVSSPVARVETNDSVLRLVDCTVTGSGDGVRARSGGTLLLDRCDIRDCGGTGVIVESTASVTNTFIVGNGKGLATSGLGSLAAVQFTTIAGNGDAFDTLSTCPAFFGVIVADNGTDVACGTGAGICVVDPVAEGFVDAAAGEYHLTAASGFVDHLADDLGNSADEDVDGDARPLLSGYDCGADEVPP